MATKTRSQSFFLPGGKGEEKYLKVRDEDRNKWIKDDLDKYWKEFEHLADNDFREDARFNFLQRFWEMYLGIVLLRVGFGLKSQEGLGPDFNFCWWGEKIWVEAIAPNPGDGPDKVPPIRTISDDIEEGLEPRAYEVPEEKIILRFASALYEKKMKFDKYIKEGLVQKRDCKIIAINGYGPMRISGEHGSIPYILKSVFPLGKQFATWQGKEVVDSGFEFRGNVEKQSGSVVPTSGFLSEEFREISGILYSNVEMGNRPERIFDGVHCWDMPEKLGTKFLFIHNPMTNCPFPKKLFYFAREYYKENSEIRVI